MMKYLFIIMLLFLAGCSQDNEKSYEQATTLPVIKTETTQPSLTLSAPGENEQQDQAESYEDYITVSSKLPKHCTTDFFSLELMDASEFRDMEYVALVKQTGDFYGASEAWYDYAIIGGEIDSYQKGVDYYEKLNVVYSQQREPIGYFSDTEEQGLIRLLFERHVIKVSTDGTKILCETYLGDYNEDRLYEVFSMNGKYYQYKYYPGSSDYDTDWVNVSNTMNYYMKDRGTNLVDIITGEKHSIKKAKIINSSDTIFACYSYNENIEDVISFEIYSIKTGEVLYSSPLIQYNDSDSIWLEYLCDDYLIFSFWNDQIELTDMTNYYKLDFATNEIQYLITSHFSGQFSPDGKYFIYSPYDYHTLLEIEGKERGFYIYELESGKTALYSTGKIYEGFGGSNETVCWINKKGIEALITKETDSSSE